MGFYFTNLWRAILQLFGSDSPIMLILNADRLVNALAAGHYRATISARVGWFELFKKNRYWAFLGWVIDQSFEPFEGPNHCYRAYLWEAKQNKIAGTNKPIYDYRRGNDIALGALSIFVVAGCIILAPILYVISLVR